ncbi:MAG TPA: cytochrome c [Pyrinomonadaceae bacterium]|nr:cytochrome c [Pyrinomonadaceae bacterium]
MKYLKLGLVLTCFALFVFACSQNSTTTTTNNNKTITQNVNGTTVSYDPANSNSNGNANKPAPANDELAAAKKIFSEKCVLCHKENGEGGDVDIEGDKFKVPSFKNEKVAAADDKKYTRVIEEGDDKMPAFKKKLTADEIAGMVKFIRKEFQGK